MQKYLTIEEASQYLGVSTETIKRYIEKGELPAYKLDRAIRFIADDLDNLFSLGVTLTSGLRAVIEHSCQIAQGIDAWRVIISFENIREEKRLIVPFGHKNEHTEYYAWVTQEYLEDHARLPGNVKGAERFALRYMVERFEETRDEKGNRDITKISENSVKCVGGKCERGDNLTLLAVT